MTDTTNRQNIFLNVAASPDGAAVLAYRVQWGTRSDGGQESSGAWNTRSWLSNVVMKLDANGSIIWTQRLLPNLSRVAVDPHGSVFAVGALFREQPNLPLVPSDYLSRIGFPADGPGSAYIAKSDSSGNLQWIRTLGTSKSARAVDVAINRKGEYWVCGFYTFGTNSFGDVALPATPPDTRNIFLAKYSPAGALQWVRYAVATQYGGECRVAVDSADNVILTIYRTSFDYTLMPDGPTFATALLKFGPDGTLLWNVTHPRNGITGGAVVSSDDSLFVTYGEPFPSDKSFLVKYAPSGALIWSRPGNFFGLTYLAMDAGDNCIVSGNFGPTYVEGTAVFPGVITFGDETLTTYVRSESYVVKYKASGDVAWAVQTEGQADGRSSPGSICVLTNGAMVAAGTLNETVNFGEIPIFGPPQNLYSGNVTILYTPAIFVSSIEEQNSALPAISVVPLGSGLRLSWPATFGTFVLETADSGLGGAWQEVSPTALEGDEIIVTVQPESAASFFRLKRI